MSNTATATSVVAVFANGVEKVHSIKLSEVAVAGEPMLSGSFYVQKHAAHRMGNPPAYKLTLEPLFPEG